MLSVIMPVLNGHRFIAQALASALSQMESDDELIVIDNGSTDDSVACVEALSDRRIILLREEKRGPAAARNRGLGQARGDLVAFLDCDDLWPAGRHAGLMQALDDNPDADAAYGRLRVRIDGATDPGFAALDGRFAPAIGLHTYLFRRALLDRIGPMDETMALGSDADYVARLRSGAMRTAIYDGDAAIYRRHDANITVDAAAIRGGIMDILARSIARKRSQSDGR